MDNISSIQQAISLSRQIQEHLNKDILKEGQPFIIWEKYEWLREVLSLLAKQSNLFESCILLLENNMEQEAYILVRSQFNNMLWISYLCNDNNSNRVKEYFYEPLITQLQQLNNIKKYLHHLPEDTPQYQNFSSLDLTTIDLNLNRIKAILKDEGYVVDNPKKPLRNKSIFELTDKEPLLLGLYNSFYNDASKFEHADISTVKNYRSQIVDDISTDIAFIFDLSTSNIILWKSVFKSTLTTLFQSINALYNRIKNHDNHLFDFKQFEEINFSSLIINIKLATDIVDSITDQHNLDNDQ
ncbi:MAG: DUF5677 domain-containing protein [Oscillospiraceae bacterium]|nr:DUF5677 domain-containing protein [Oscillospiraceae bacterium]